MYIPVLLGTAREGRRSLAVALKVEELIRAAGHETEFFDVRESGLAATSAPGNQEFLERWREAMQRAIGFVIVTPEYNHGYPGELKLFLDSFFSEFENKLVAVVSVANGLWGGTRVTEQLRPVLNAFNMIVLGMAIHLRNTGAMIEDGVYSNPELPEYINILLKKFEYLGSRLA